MSNRRLSDEEFAEVQQVINSPEEGIGIADLQKRRDYLLDLAGMMKDEKDSAKYLVWASQLDLRIQKISKVAQS